MSSLHRRAQKKSAQSSNWGAELDHLTQIIEAKTEARLALNDALISDVQSDSLSQSELDFAEKDYVFYIIEMLIVFEARDIYVPERMEDFLTSLNARRRTQIERLEATDTTAVARTRMTEIRKSLFSDQVIKRAIANARHYSGIEQKTLIRVMARHMSAPYAKQSLSLLRRAGWIEWSETDFGGISTRATPRLILAYKDYAARLVDAAKGV